MSSAGNDDLGAVGAAIQSARYNESVVVTVDCPNGSDAASPASREIVLVAQIDEENGGVVWRGAKTSETQGAELDPVVVRHLRTKKWFLPMLNDKRRNELYEKAVREACHAAAFSKSTVAPTNDGTEKESEKKVMKILDIGSGTGLLAMMATKHSVEALMGGETSEHEVVVTSLEMASAMARIARRTVASNKMEDYLEIIESHSCDPAFTLPSKACLCTSELLESGLLGEGILPALRNAWERHLTEGAVIVPQRARVFAQVLEGAECIGHFRGPSVGGKQRNSEGDEFSLCPSSDQKEVLLGCTETQSGGINVPLHAEALLESAKQLTDPTLVLEFNFTSKDAMPPPEGRSEMVTLTPIASGTAHGVIFWWELDLWDGITYSTEPGKGPWQDHWQQCLFVFGCNNEHCPTLVKDDEFHLFVSHDDSSISFVIHCGDKQPHRNASKRQRRDEDSDRTLQIQSTPTMSRHISPERAMQLNDLPRLDTLQAAINTAIRIKGRSASMLDLSDFSLCAIMAATATEGGATRITSVESSTGGLPLLSAKVAQLGNNLPKEGKEEVVQQFQILNAHAENLSCNDIYGGSADVVMAEPYYEILEGWHLQEALNYYYLVRAMKRKELVSSDAISVPSYASIKGCGVELDADFAASYGSIGQGKGESSICGLDHNLVSLHGARYHTYDAAFPLWQYKHTELTDHFEIARIQYEGNAQAMAILGNDSWSAAKFQRPGTCHALIFWVEYGLRVCKEGSEGFAQISTKTRGHKQGVRLMLIPIHVEKDSLGHATLLCKGEFGGLDSGEGNSFELKIEQ